MRSRSDRSGFALARKRMQSGYAALRSDCQGRGRLPYQSCATRDRVMTTLSPFLD